MATLLRSQIMSFSRSIPALVDDFQEFSVKTDGHMTSVVMHFPPGPQFLVDVRIGVKPRGSNSIIWIVPSEDESFIRDDDAVKPFVVDAVVTVGDVVRVQWKNFDGANPHEVPVDATIQPFVSGGISDAPPAAGEPRATTSVVDVLRGGQ